MHKGRSVSFAPDLAVGFALCGLALVAGCASSSTSGNSGTASDGRVVTGLSTDRGPLAFSVDDRPSSTDIEVAREELWPKVVAAYVALDLEPDQLDEAGFRVGRSAFVVRRRLVGARLSRLVDCGTTMTGPMADQARVTFTISSAVVPADRPGASRLATTVEAVAVPDDGVGTARSCTTRGVLEERVLRLVLEAISG